LPLFLGMPSYGSRGQKKALVEGNLQDVQNLTRGLTIESLGVLSLKMESRVCDQVNNQAGERTAGMAITEPRPLLNSMKVTKEGDVCKKEWGGKKG